MSIPLQPSWQPRAREAPGAGSRPGNGRDGDGSTGLAPLRAEKVSPDGMQVPAPDALTGADDQHAVHGLLRGEEGGHLVVVEGDSGGPVSVRIRTQVQSPRHDPRLELGHPIPTVPCRVEDAIQIRKQETHRRRVASQPLLQTQERGLPTELPRPEQVEPVLPVREGPGRQPRHGVRDQEGLRQPEAGSPSSSNATACGGPGDAWTDRPSPTGTTQRGNSRSGSSPNRATISASANPRTTRARRPSAATTASTFATIMPASQKRCRYPRSPYFHAVRQGIPVSTRVAGAPATAGSPPQARTRYPR